jgi:hypothetical protein
MRSVRGRRFLRRWFTYGTLAALVALVSVSLTQCRMVNVDDSATGIGFESRATGQCVADCNRTANDAIREESDFHVSQVRACHGNSACLQNESERHVAAVQSIQDAREACKANCHHQGGGSGGR